MLLKCCSIHKAVIILRRILYLVHICPWLCSGLFMSYLCDLFFIFSFMFFIINHINSNKQMHMFFVHISEHLILFWMEGAYGVTKYGNIQGFFLKILFYRKIFFKIPIPKHFSASKVFVCISRQPKLNSFKNQRSIKYLFYKNVIHHTTYDFFKCILKA